MQKTILNQLLKDKSADTRDQVSSAYTAIPCNYEFAVSVSLAEMQNHMDAANEKGFIAWCNEDGISAIIYGAGQIGQDDFTDRMTWLNTIRLENDVAMAHFMANDGEKFVEIK